MFSCAPVDPFDCYETVSFITTKREHPSHTRPRSLPARVVSCYREHRRKTASQRCRSDEMAARRLIKWLLRHIVDDRLEVEVSSSALRMTNIEVGAQWQMGLKQHSQQLQSAKPCENIEC